MNAPADPVTGPATRDAVRSLARLALTLAVRGRGGTGGPWGEAALAELDRVHGRWAAVRWSAGGVRTALRERRALRRDLPRAVRIRRRAVAVLVLGLLAAAGVQQWLLTPAYQPSPAMAPALQAGDYWLMDRVSHRLTGLHHGDVVAYDPGGGASTVAVRRVVGLPGDVVACRDGRLVRNGAPLTEPYLHGGPAVPAGGCPTVTVPAGAVYALGDDRTGAAPGGPVPQERVQGRLLTRLWNAGPDGSPFAPPAAPVH